MLEFSRQILENVSFDSHLFSKELQKLIVWINDKEEIQQLHTWCKSKYGGIYPDIIYKSFAN